MADHSKEKLLAGGNVSEVYLNGNTVRRIIKPNSSRIHLLLNHLEIKRFHQAPKFQGIDEKGREILSYIKGEAGNYPLKKYMWSDEVLVEIARMLRTYHDAVSDFSFDKNWQAIDHTPEPYEIICHNDFAIYNIIFQNEKPIGVIDFDVAAPGPKLWDVAYTMYTCVPLSRFYLNESGKKVLYEPSKHANHLKRRLIIFLESYGIEFDRRILDMVLLRLEGVCATIIRKANEGDTAFQKMMEEGHLEHYRKDIKFIKEHRADWF